MAERSHSLLKVRVYHDGTENLGENILRAAGDGAREYVREAVSAALKAEGKPQECEISVIFTSDRNIRELNQRYREVDRVTDILCFPYSAKPPFKCEIFISLEVSSRNAAEFRHSHGQEITFLVIHGILHLLGWRDNTDALRSRMLGRQSEIMRLLPLK